MVDVRTWHIASFRCDAEVVRYHRIADLISRPLGRLWVRSLIDLPGWSSRNCWVIALLFAGDVGVQNSCGVCAITPHFPIQWNRPPQPRRACPGASRLAEITLAYSELAQSRTGVARERPYRPRHQRPARIPTLRGSRTNGS